MTKAQLATVGTLLAIVAALGTLAGKLSSNGQERGELLQRVHDAERRLDRLEQRADYYFGKGDK